MSQETDFDTDSVDWTEVERSLRQANNALRDAEQEIAEGFSDDIDVSVGLASAAYEANLPNDIDELITGVTNSSSHLRNGTLSFLPTR